MAGTRISSQVLKSLAQDRRPVAADWRVQIAYTRAALSNGFALPDVRKTKRLINKLQAAGDVEQIRGIPGVYRITIPYASVLPCPDEAIIQEANPTAVFSHFTAAQYHNLTYEIPNEIHLAEYRDSAVRLPLGTTPEDWMDVPKPRQRTPKSIHGTRIHWHKTRTEWDFGNSLGHVQACPIYVTDVERTLLDALRFPNRCGGATEVLRIWRRGINSLDVDTLIEYVEKFGQTLLRQRVGFLLEQLGESHPKFDEWAANSVRGSSAKLFPNVGFSPEYSSRWNLSLNAPSTILSDISLVESLDIPT